MGAWAPRWQVVPNATYPSQPASRALQRRPNLLDYLSDPKVIVSGLVIAGLAYWLGRAGAVGKEKAVAEAGHAMESLGRKAASKIADKALAKALKGIGL